MQGYNLITGLADLSGELGESTTNSDTKRIRAYNDAVIAFANDRKFPFLVKKNATLSTTKDIQSYTLPTPAMDDRRSPGPIKAIYIGTSTEPVDPENYNLSEDELTINFLNTIEVTGSTITIYYYYIPTRLTNKDDLTTLFPIPDRYRKVVSTLAAAFVQWSRYLDAQGNRMYNLYEKLLGGVSNQQAEKNAGNPRKFQHYLTRIGFKRTYP